MSTSGTKGAFTFGLLGKNIIKNFLPETPSVDEAPKPPTKDDPEVQAASARERKLLRLKRGRQSTILSSSRRQQTGDTLG